MKKPPIKHVVRSHTTQLQYSIYAHRQLTRQEITAVIRNYDGVKFQPPTTGKVEIVTMIGLRESGRKQ